MKLKGSEEVLLLASIACWTACFTLFSIQFQFYELTEGYYSLFIIDFLCFGVGPIFFNRLQPLPEDYAIPADSESDERDRIWIWLVMVFLRLTPLLRVALFVVMILSLLLPPPPGSGGYITQMLEAQVFFVILAYFPNSAAYTLLFSRLAVVVSTSYQGFDHKDPYLYKVFVFVLSLVLMFLMSVRLVVRAKERSHLLIKPPQVETQLAYGL